jgi:alpha-N-acetylglucosamine transferase
MTGTTFRGPAHTATLVLTTILALIVFTSLYINSDALLHHVGYEEPVSSQSPELWQDIVTPPLEEVPNTQTQEDAQSTQPQKLQNEGTRYAFATLFAGPSANSDDEDFTHNNYFTGIRLLAYQLLHHPQTRSNNIPFVVFVSQNTSEAKRERLRKDGAIVKEVAPIHSAWVKAQKPDYAEVLSKLRIWEHTEYDLICLLDGDTVLTRPLDGVFKDPAVAIQTTGNKRDAESYKEDEGPQPRTYVFAASLETAPQHGYPPTIKNGDYGDVNKLNAGFMVFRPDKELFAHYMAVLAQPNRFDSSLPEQNLLNYVHRREGNMPWKVVGNTWNINFPNKQDIKGGVASMHEKFWKPWNKEMAEYLGAWRYRMEGFFEALDELR